MSIGVTATAAMFFIDEGEWRLALSLFVIANIGISGSFTPEAGLELLKEADLVVAVGCSLAYHAGGGGQLWPKAKTLQIDIDPVAVSQGQETARHHLRADARLGVEALTAALPARNRSWRTDAMAARIRDSKPDSHVFEIEPGSSDAS